MARSGTPKGKGRGRGTALPDGAIMGVTASDLQALMASFARLETDPGDEALDLAQEKAFDAMEAPTARERIALAREALALSPLCADAYAVLARETRDAGEALDLYRRAVTAGADALGEQAFQDDVGSFWSLIQTRPYMRARHELGMALWRAGNRDEAVEHYQDMLRLNPNDNQGIRELLLDALLELGREADAAALLKRYKEDGSAAWAWSGALLAFRRKGDGALARKALRRAVDSNRHVADYLLGRKRLPRTLPAFVGRGDRDEAVAYVHGAAGAWAAAAGAKAWLAAALADEPKAGVRTRADHPPGAVADRIDEAALALLVLGLHDGDRVWKTFDWEVMSRLHEKGLISDPASRAKSVVLTPAGMRAAKTAHDTLFNRDPTARS